MGIKTYAKRFQAASDKGLWWAGALSSFFATLLSIVLTFGVQEFIDGKKEAELNHDMMVGYLKDGLNNYNSFSTVAEDVENNYGIASEAAAYLAENGSVDGISEDSLSAIISFLVVHDQVSTSDVYDKMFGTIEAINSFKDNELIYNIGLTIDTKHKILNTIETINNLRDEIYKEYYEKGLDAHADGQMYADMLNLPKAKYFLDRASILSQELKSNLELYEAQLNYVIELAGITQEELNKEVAGVDENAEEADSADSEESEE